MHVGAAATTAASTTTAATHGMENQQNQKASEGNSSGEPLSTRSRNSKQKQR
jgi:hypothetical protein